MAIEKELLDQLLAGRDPNEVFAKEIARRPEEGASRLLCRNGPRNQTFQAYRGIPTPMP